MQGDVSQPVVRRGETVRLILAVLATALTWSAAVLRDEPLTGAEVAGRLVVTAALWAAVARDLPGRRREGVLGGERTFRALLEAAPDAMVIVDETGAIVLVNSQAERLFGYDRRELLGQPVERLIPMDLRERHLANRRGYAKEPRPRTMGAGLELAALRRDGTTFPVDIALGPLAGETGTLVSAAIRDITERKRTERALRDFLATLGHELRNPMAAISNATRLLRHPDVTADQARWSQEILEAEGRHMTRLIDDLLDLSRIARNTIELRGEPVDFTRVMDRVLDSTRASIEQHGHQIGVSLPRAPLPLHADPVRLAQVFCNLIDNASKYSPRGSRIEVEGRCAEGALVVSVRDRGNGISGEALPRLFDMFYRADRSLERHEGGLGIGLTLVKQLVELHGGSVEAASDGPGRGSTFTVRLPLVEAPADTAAPEPPPAPEAAPGRRVLVVDDNRRAADSLAVLLRLDGHDVATAYDGREALATADRIAPEVVLLDIGMPGLSGYDVAREMRTRPWGRTASLVALTGLGTPEDRARAHEAGFDTHLVKPVDVDVLQKLLAGLPPA